MAQKRSSNSPSSEAKKIRIENDPTSSHDLCFGENSTFSSSLLQRDPYTNLNPFLTDAINELNDGLRATLRHDIQSPNPGLTDNLTATQTQLPHHDVFLELNQSLLTLQNSLNDQDQPVQLNPFLIEAVNQLNDSFNLSNEQSVINATLPVTCQHQEPASQQDLLHGLNQNLILLNDNIINLINQPVNVLQNPETDHEYIPEMVNDTSVNAPPPSVENVPLDHVDNAPTSVENVPLAHVDNATPSVENVPLDHVDNAPPSVENVPLDHVDNAPPSVENNQIGHGVDSNIRIINRGNFNNTEIIRRVNFSSIANVNSFAEFYNYVLEILNSVIEVANEMISPKDYVTVEIRGVTLNVSSHIQLVNGAIDLQSFLTMLENTIQSNRDIFTDKSLELVVQIVRPPRGGIGCRRKVATIFNSEVVQKKMRHLYIFYNKDMCFALCVTQLLNRDKSDFQNEKIAKQLQYVVGLTENTPVTFADVSKFEAHVQCKIVIVYKTSDKAGFSFFQTSKTPHEKTLYLFLHDNHYYGVKNITGFLGCSYVCHFCHSGVKDMRNHSCAYSCNVCCDVDCYKHPQNITKCPDCMRLCRSKYCFDSHKALRQSEGGEFSQCNRGFYCSKCNSVYNNPFGLKRHVCPESLCQFCGEKLETDCEHRCFIQPLKREKSNRR
ncbi:uncharacterized protein LOC125141154 [Tachysurus fulvidraco]|uniref:uncharacterized protein LOC125141154 n=1 Tax=Tachysurus fulvidraco TaxID=1234273 RepID=UPI001FED7F25|nr:uncharacterized protein LOC125141154 [Tachysurus fulvidraco]